MSEPVVDFDNPKYIEQVRRKKFPTYFAIAKIVDEWKKKEDYALERKKAAAGPLTKIFWQLKYLSAVGNGAEAERCRDGLFDPFWGCISTADNRKTAMEADCLAIQDYNSLHRRMEP